MHRLSLIMIYRWQLYSCVDFYKELLHVFFPPVDFQKPRELSNEGIIIISMLKLRRLRLALVPKYPSALTICALAGDYLQRFSSHTVPRRLGTQWPCGTTLVRPDKTQKKGSHFRRLESVLGAQGWMEVLSWVSVVRQDKAFYTLPSWEFTQDGSDCVCQLHQVQEVRSCFLLLKW